jgi:hypothetical protein
MVSPTRSPEECAPLVDQVRAHPDSFSPVPPQISAITIPPLEGTPHDMRGARVTILILVDEKASVVADSTTFTPLITSPSYDREPRKSLSKYHFYPAVLEGCAVPGRTKVELTLPNR